MRPEPIKRAGVQYRDQEKSDRVFGSDPTLGRYGARSCVCHATTLVWPATLALRFFHQT